MSRREEPYSIPMGRDYLGRSTGPPLIAERASSTGSLNWRADQLRDQGEKPTEPPQTPEKQPPGLKETRVACHLNDALESLWKAFKECQDQEKARRLVRAMYETKGAQLNCCVERKDVAR